MQHLKSFGCVIAIPVLLNSVAYASLIDLDSGPGLTTNLPQVTVAVNPYPRWQQNDPVNPGDPSDTSAVWVSYADTGYFGSVFQPSEGTTSVVTVSDTFSSDAGTLTLNVWADDTADVLLDGTQLMQAQASFLQTQTCSGQVIGCTPADVGSFVTSLSAGSHTLEFVLYQTGSGTNTVNNPFGLLYSGTAPAASDPFVGPVPEPASWLLFGTALPCALWIGRRRKSGRLLR